MLQNEWVQMEEGWPPEKSCPLAQNVVHKKLAPPLIIIIVSYQQVFRYVDLQYRQKTEHTT